MRGQGCKNVVAENVLATSANLNVERKMASKKRMCWKCQKDKSTIGGHIKTWNGGPMKFVCKECLEAKQKEVIK